MKSLILTAVLASTLSLSAHATLGQAYDTVEADRMQFHAQVRTTARPIYTMHEMNSPDGVVVKEFVDKQGIVFAVNWRGPWRPDMQQLLGDYFGSLRHDPSGPHISGRYPIDVKRDDLVIHTEGHMHAFSGFAYLPKKVPTGVDPAELH